MKPPIFLKNLKIALKKKYETLVGFNEYDKLALKVSKKIVVLRISSVNQKTNRPTWSDYISIYLYIIFKKGGFF